LFFLVWVAARHKEIGSPPGGLRLIFTILGPEIAALHQPPNCFVRHPDPAPKYGAT
jgi:hypothetical protein